MNNWRHLIIYLAVAVATDAAVPAIDLGSVTKGAEAALQSAAAGSVPKICSHTDHPKLCSDTLTPVANNKSATIIDYLKAAINVARAEVEAAMGRPAEIAKGATAPQEKMAVGDCKELLQYAVEELQASMSVVGDSSLHNITDREAELKNRP